MCLDTTSTPAASGFICCNLERCPLPKCQVCYDRLQSCSLSVILEKMSASDSQRQPLFPSARKSVKYLKPPLFSLRMFWTIKDDLCKLYSYFMHDKHHYLDNYCSRERERRRWRRKPQSAGGKLLPETLFHWNPKTFWKHVTSFVFTTLKGFLLKMIRFAQQAEHRTLCVFNSSLVKYVAGRKSST